MDGKGICQIFAKEMMDWNSCLTIGLGEGVGVALRRSGVLEGPGSGGWVRAWGP